MKILLASPRGFCAGVEMAIEALDKALELLGAPIYVYHEIVHNKHVVDRFCDQGVTFVDELDEVPVGSNLLYSAHGVSPEIREAAAKRKLNAIDATCPLVTKVHLEARKFAQQGYTMFLIGHEGHDEVIGTMGEAPERIILVETPEEVGEVKIAQTDQLAYLTQTTLSVDDANRVIDALKARFPNIIGPPKEDICYATQNRQESVRAIAEKSQVVIVVGSGNSSNSIRLTEVARECGAESYRVDCAAELNESWFEGIDTVGLTAGASAPEELVNQCIDWFRQCYGAEVEPLKLREEDVYFPLPRPLRVLN